MRGAQGGVSESAEARCEVGRPAFAERPTVRRSALADGEALLAGHATLKAAGVPVPPVVYGDWSAQSGYEAGRAIALAGEATAVFTANDHMALGLMRALDDAGVQVPGDLSVVGFDDVAEAAYFKRR